MWLKTEDIKNEQLLDKTAERKIWLDTVGGTEGSHKKLHKTKKYEGIDRVRKKGFKWSS